MFSFQSIERYIFENDRTYLKEFPYLYFFLKAQPKPLQEINVLYSTAKTPELLTTDKLNCVWNKHKFSRDIVGTYS